MDKVSILKIILFQINWVLICSIRVSIKPFTFQQTDLVEESYTSIFDWQFWFSDSSKTRFWHCKILTFKLLPFVPTSLKSSIKFPTETFLPAAWICKKTLFWAEANAKLTESAQNFQLFESHQHSNLFFSKSKDWLLRKRLQSENLRL